MSETGIRKNSGIIIVCVNLLLICCITAVVAFYSSTNRARLRQQNMSDITNINQASANISGDFFQNQQKRLADAVQYITLSGLDRNEALAYICDSNSDKNGSFELVGTDCTGYASLRTGDGFQPVDYTDNDYANLQTIFRNGEKGGSGEIMCTPEFTDGCTARKSFALYSAIMLENDGKTERYTLLNVFESSSFAGLIELNGGYEGMAATLVDASGDYIFGSQQYKSDNLFKYFYDYNGLTLDEKKSLCSAFASSEKGEYYYKNSRGQDCVFVYTAVPDTGWFCVCCVPLSSFRSAYSDWTFIAWIAALLLVLMGFNVLWLERSNRRLRISVRKEKDAGDAKTDFLSRMSHDIRTPLNGIIGLTILAGREDNPPSTTKYLEDIDQSGKFLLSLVNDILDLNKVESGKMELHPAPYTMEELHDNIGAIISPLCREKGQELEIKCGGTGKAYMLDSVRVEQIFFNILSNSVKFTPPGGRITLECTEQADENGSDMLLFRASDNGQGMSDEFQRHMYEAFSQEQKADSTDGQGTGLGLAIVKNLVDLMGGLVRVNSEKGVGTVFNIAIPARRAEVNEKEEKSPGPGEAVLNGRRVLLFEDNRINAEIAETLLRDRGMEVDRAADGREGLEMFKASETGHYDLILMDLRMPVMNGFETTAAIRALERADAVSVPIVAMTANAYEADVQNCIAAGMNAHIAKPIDPDKMFETIAEVIA